MSSSRDNELNYVNEVGVMSTYMIQFTINLQSQHMSLYHLLMAMVINQQYLCL